MGRVFFFGLRVSDEKSIQLPVKSALNISHDHVLATGPKSPRLSSLLPLTQPPAWRTSGGNTTLRVKSRLISKGERVECRDPFMVGEHKRRTTASTIFIFWTLRAVCVVEMPFLSPSRRGQNGRSSSRHRVINKIDSCVLARRVGSWVSGREWLIGAF